MLTLDFFGGNGLTSSWMLFTDKFEWYSPKIKIPEFNKTIPALSDPTKQENIRYKFSLLQSLESQASPE